jgi:hypothetical protein
MTIDFDPVKYNDERRKKKEQERWERLKKDRSFMGRLKMLDYVLGGYKKYNRQFSHTRYESSGDSLLGVISIILFWGGIALAISLIA